MSSSFLRQGWDWLVTFSSTARRRERALKRRRFRHVLHEALEDRRVMTGYVSLYTGSHATEGDSAVNGFYISYSTPTDLNLTLDWGSGTAGLSSDYTAATGILLPSGSSSAFVSVSPVNDTAVEATETIANLYPRIPRWSFLARLENHTALR